MAKILIIDDNITIVRLLQMQLGRHGLEGHFYMAGEPGLKAARGIQPDLAVLDYDLPDIKGVDVMRQLREMPGLETLPVVMITARTSSGLLPSLLKAGANNVLSKPFSPVELVHLIQALLKEHG
ncbi:MAG: response regulator [Puniceicoccales bacterium]